MGSAVQSVQVLALRRLDEALLEGLDLGSGGISESPGYYCGGSGSLFVRSDIAQVEDGDPLDGTTDLWVRQEQDHPGLLVLGNSMSDVLIGFFEDLIVRLPERRIESVDHRLRKTLPRRLREQGPAGVEATPVGDDTGIPKGTPSERVGVVDHSSDPIESLRSEAQVSRH